MAGQLSQAHLNDIVLDFSSLFSKEPTEEKKAAIIELVDIPAKTLEIQAKQAEEEHKQTLELYKAYEDNTIRSEQLQSAIRKGIDSGEDIYSLFLQAIEAISLMTNNPAFLTDTERRLAYVYGYGLHKESPLKLEIMATKIRLERLVVAEKEVEDYGGQERLQRAITAHRERIDTLERIIKRG